MRRLVFISVLLLCCRQLQAHEPEEFWWHPNAMDVDYLIALDIDSVMKVLDTMNIPDSIFFAKIDVIKANYLHDKYEVSYLMISDLINSIYEGVSFTEKEYKLIGLMLLQAEYGLMQGMSYYNDSAYYQEFYYKDLNHPVEVAALFFYLKSYMRTVGSVFQRVSKGIKKAYDAAKRMHYWEPLGELSGWLLARGEISSDEFLDLYQQLSPRAKTYALIYYTSIDGYTSDNLWHFREMYRLGSPRNIFGLFRGSIELVSRFMESGQLDSVPYYMDIAENASRMINDIEVDYHLVSAQLIYTNIIGDSVKAKQLRQRKLELDSINTIPKYLLSSIQSRTLAFELQNSEKRLSYRNRQLYVLVGIMGGMIVLLVVLVYRVLRQRKELHRANADKTMLYGMIAHDLRTPLSALDGLMEQDDMPATIRQPFTTYSRRLRFLLDDMLKWTFTQQQQLQPQKAPFDMVELVEENLSFLELAIKDRQMHLTLEMEEEVHMLADREMIGTCIRNMLQNAIKHGERGTELIVTCREAPGEVELVIRNHGSLQWNTGRSLGLQLIQSFSRMNNCRFTLNEQDGWVVARLTGPVVQATTVS